MQDEEHAKLQTLDRILDWWTLRKGTGILTKGEEKVKVIVPVVLSQLGRPRNSTNLRCSNRPFMEQLNTGGTKNELPLRITDELLNPQVPVGSQAKS